MGRLPRFRFWPRFVLIAAFALAVAFLVASDSRVRDAPLVIGVGFLGGVLAGVVTLGFQIRRGWVPKPVPWRRLGGVLPLLAGVGIAASRALEAVGGWAQVGFTAFCAGFIVTLAFRPVLPERDTWPDGGGER